MKLEFFGSKQLYALNVSSARIGGTIITRTKVSPVIFLTGVYLLISDLYIHYVSLPDLWSAFADISSCSRNRENKNKLGCVIECYSDRCFRQCIDFFSPSVKCVGHV